MAANKNRKPTPEELIYSTAQNWSAESFKKLLKALPGISKNEEQIRLLITEVAKPLRKNWFDPDTEQEPEIAATKESEEKIKEYKIEKIKKGLHELSLCGIGMYYGDQKKPKDSLYEAFECGASRSDMSYIFKEAAFTFRDVDDVAVGYAAGSATDLITQFFTNRIDPKSKPVIKNRTIEPLDLNEYIDENNTGKLKYLLERVASLSPGKEKGNLSMSHFVHITEYCINKFVKEGKEVYRKEDFTEALYKLAGGTKLKHPKGKQKVGAKTEEKIKDIYRELTAKKFS